MNVFVRVFGNHTLLHRQGHLVDKPARFQDPISTSKIALASRNFKGPDCLNAKVASDHPLGMSLSYLCPTVIEEEGILFYVTERDIGNVHSLTYS